MVKIPNMTNALDPYWGDKKDTKTWKKSWDRTKFTMAVQKMATPKLKYSEKIGRIILGSPKDNKKDK
jgi:hypothetical protein